MTAANRMIHRTSVRAFTIMYNRRLFLAAPRSILHTSEAGVPLHLTRASQSIFLGIASSFE